MNSKLIFVFVLTPAPFPGKTAYSTQPYVALSRSLSPLTQPESHPSTNSPCKPRSCNFSDLTTQQSSFFRLRSYNSHRTPYLSKTERKDHQRTMKSCAEIWSERKK